MPWDQEHAYPQQCWRLTRQRACRIWPYGVQAYTEGKTEYQTAEEDGSVNAGA